MKSGKIIKFTIPFLILFALCGLLWRELFYSSPGELPSALIGENVPAFSLPNLFDPMKSFTPSDFKGRVALVNVWATWCYACSLEQPLLMQIKEKYNVPIYSIDYKDNPKDAKEWLEKNGNPYVMTGSDLHGDTAIDFGVYGTPETFVISPQGKIIYRYVGAINEKDWNEILYPLIKKYEA
jgi:cytochrome c biogenesis protein CcmG/thiol:disulfide interchange protein DsbE